MPTIRRRRQKLWSSSCARRAGVVVVVFFFLGLSLLGCCRRRYNYYGGTPAAASSSSSPPSCSGAAAFVFLQLPQRGGIFSPALFSSESLSDHDHDNHDDTDDPKTNNENVTTLLSSSPAAAGSSSSSAREPCCCSTEQVVAVHSNLLKYVGVRPFVVLQGRPVRRRLALWTWHTRGLVLRVLHLLDPLRPPNRCINLECLWYKTLAANNRTSPIADGGLSYDLLPRFSRWVVARPFARLYPRLVHGRLEIRAAYLERAVRREIDEYNRRQRSDRNDDEHKKKQKSTKFRVMYLGAGYEVRSIKLLTGGVVDECYDLDLPDVIATKRRLLDERLRRRRPELFCVTGSTSNEDTSSLENNKNFPRLIGIDLNDVDDFERRLEEILLPRDGQDEEEEREGSVWYNIFVAEGVLMYLKDGNSGRILDACARVAAKASRASYRALNAAGGVGSTGTASLCFADRLENVTGVNMTECQAELQRASWNLVDWAPNPYMNARHIGTARLCRYGV